MRLESGARLGPYEIEAPLGAGGMGEVYRARDTRLDRTVAVKVLPEEFSANESVRARFEREAKTISSLTHPNICTLHDVGREGDTEYLVMEFLDGESLSVRLDRGPLPLDEAIRYGIQIADALDRAHRSGIVHRDLKPGNVMLTQSGAKLLDARGGTWSDNGWIVYAPASNGELMRIPASGGEAVAITNRQGEPEVISHRWPWYLPGGKRLLFLAQTAEGGKADDASMTRVLDLETNQTKSLFNANSSVQYSSAGYVLYWSQGSLLAKRFDPASLEIADEVMPIAEGVLYTGNEYAAFSQALNGHLLVQKASSTGGLSELAWIELDGTRSATIRNPGGYRDPKISPDNRRLAVENDGDIWVIDLERDSSARLTFEESRESDPAWSHDGEWIYFSSVADNKPTIRRKRSSGVGDEEVLVERPARCYPAQVSPDGGNLAILEEAPDGDYHILVVDLETLEVAPIVTSPFTNVTPRFGPTSDWIAHTSNETGRYEVYAQKITGSGGRWQISTDGGSREIWSREGDVVYFLRDGAAYAVDVDVRDSLEAGIPRKLFDVPYRGGAQVPFDITSDGQRFVFVVGGEAEERDEPMTLIQNWTRMLER